MVIPQIAIVYINTEYLIPHFLVKKKYLQYFLSVGLLLIGLYLTYKFIHINNLSVPEDFQRRFDDFRRATRRKEHGRPHIMGLRPAFDFILALAVLILSTAYKTSKLALEKEKEASLLRSEKLDAELKFLKSQINPHFLFNALNNVYALSVIKSESTPSIILKLSDILRYILYDCNTPKVALGRELDYIKNYVDLFQLKDEKKLDVKLDIDQVDRKILIEPMLFTPFIENSFKHSKIEDTESGWIRTEMTSQEKQLHFTVKNSMPDTVYSKDKVGGIGLENVKRRLMLLYPDRHELKVSKDGNEFKINLTILL